MIAVRCTSATALLARSNIININNLLGLQRSARHWFESLQGGHLQPWPTHFFETAFALGSPWHI